MWGPLSWPPGSPVVDVVEIVKTRAAAEAVGVPTALTMGVPASSAKVTDDPAVEATSMNPLLWGPLSWLPGSPVIDVVKIVEARVAAGAARPVEESLLKGFSGGVSSEVACKDSLARTLLFTR